MINSLGVTASKITEPLTNPLAWLGGIFMGIISFLVGVPGPAFYALWVSVGCDLVSRVMSESVQHGGLIPAIRDGHIQSDKMIQGAKLKIPAYFIMCVFACQIDKFPYEYAYVGSSIIYGIFFLAELESTCENFIEAGIEEFGWLKRFSKRKLEKMCDDGGEYSNDQPV